jgi:serine/threonine protein kinase
VANTDVASETQNNVLVDADGKYAKICDFGSASIDCACYAGSAQQDGTVPWDSPELWLFDEEGPRTYRSDIWAFGCVALEVGSNDFENTPHLSPRLSGCNVNGTMGS